MSRFDRCPRIRLRGPGASGFEGPALEAYLADTAWRRTAGLALLGEPPGRALLIPRCASVHTFGMRFPIDVAFVAWAPGDERGLVLEVRPAVAPRRGAMLARRLRPGRRSGIAALEMAAGQAGELGIEPGAELAIEPLGPS